jgi:hypothetical protein
LPQRCNARIQPRELFLNLRHDAALFVERWWVTYYLRVIVVTAETWYCCRTIHLPSRKIFQ